MSVNEVLYVRSSKNNGRSSSEDTSTNDDDVWDDTMLIEAYNKGIEAVKGEAMRRMQDASHTKSKKVWKIGDKCKCQYSEDNNYYEANVIDIIDSVGMCIVKYVGYENEEKVLLKKLLPSDGENARAVQMREAMSENEYSASAKVESANESNYERKRTQFEQNKSFTSKKKDKCKSSKEKSVFGTHSHNFQPPGFSMPPPMSNFMPPPPPPHLFANLSQGDCEAEAMSAMLMSWYMSGYHTGYYQGLKSAKK